MGWIRSHDLQPDSTKEAMTGWMTQSCSCLIYDVGEVTSCWGGSRTSTGLACSPSSAGSRWHLVVRRPGSTSGPGETQDQCVPLVPS